MPAFTALTKDVWFGLRMLRRSPWFTDYCENLKLVSAVALGRLTPLSIGEKGETARAWTELVSANYFDSLKE